MGVLKNIHSGMAGRALALAALVLLAACSTTPRRAGAPDPHYKVGKSYQVNGRWYHPEEDPSYDRTGVASWYGADFHGRLTANGEIYDMNRLSAAHKTLPLPSMVEVTNLENGRKTIVRVNDRGPFAGDRLIDMSREAARALGFEGQGLAKVRVRFLGRADLQAKAPARGDRVRIARATPVIRTHATPRPSAVDANPEPEIAEPPSREASTILAAMEAAPALTPGAEEVVKAEATVENSGAAPAIIPAADLSTDAPDDAVLVGVTPGAEPPTSVEALYLVRVASLSRLDNIEALKQELEPIGPLRVARVVLEDARVFYRVNMGPFANIQSAVASLEAVRLRGYHDAAMVTLSP